MDLREAAERLLDDMDRRFAISPADATRLFITYGHWEAITEQLRAALYEEFDTDPADKHPTQTEVKPVAYIATDGTLRWVDGPRVVYSKQIPLYLHPQDHDDLYGIWKSGFEAGRRKK